MKRDNNLIKMTNLDTGEFRYFTKDTYVQTWIGCSATALTQIKGNNCKKFPNWKYEIVEAGDIKWKDINITNY